MMPSALAASGAGGSHAGPGETGELTSRRRRASGPGSASRFHRCIRDAAAERSSAAERLRAGGRSGRHPLQLDRSDIRPGDAKILDANAAWLQAHVGNLVLIEGYCDERGTNEYSMALGDRRAKTAMNYLVSRGIGADRISILSYGEQRPFCTDHHEACWAKNRRARFLIKPE